MAQELHASRMRRERGLVVVTGRGWGNLRQEPILRSRVEEWLRTPEARSLGVRSHRVVAKGGALDITLVHGADDGGRGRGARRPDPEDWDDDYER